MRDRLLLSEQFPKTVSTLNPYKIAQEMCQWVNGISKEDTKKVVSISIFGTEQATYGGVVFYWSD